jgi:hypothetical protein
MVSAQSWSSKFLLFRLGIPFMILSVLFFWLSCAASDDWWQSLWMDLAVTSLGVIVTVFIVEALLERHEELEWVGAKNIADDRLKRTATRIIATIADHDPDLERRESYRVGMDVIRLRGEASLYFRYSDQRWKEYVTQKVLPELSGFVSTMDEVDLDRLWRVFEYTSGDFAEIVATFRNILSPEDIEHISSIQVTMRHARFDYSPSYEWSQEDLSRQLGQVVSHCVDLINRHV